MTYSKSAQDKGRWYEKEVAKEYGGKKQSLSGAHWATKSDVKTNQFLIEVKFTTNEAYSLHYEDLVNCFNYAYRSGKIPIFQIGFYGGQEFVIVDYDTFDIESKTGEIYIKPGLRSKSLNKYDLLEKPEIKVMIYNKLKTLVMTKKIFKELVDNEQKISDSSDKRSE